MCGQRTRTAAGTGPGRPSALYELKRNHRNLHTQEDTHKREGERGRARESAVAVPPPPYLFAFAFAQGPRVFQVEDALTRTHRMINKFFSSIFYELFSLFFTTFNFFRCVFYSNFLLLVSCEVSFDDETNRRWARMRRVVFFCCFFFCLSLGTSAAAQGESCPFLD